VPPVIAPQEHKPVIARFAKRAVFQRLALVGGATRCLTCATEANRPLTGPAWHAFDVHPACSLSLILDGAAGWGDPMPGCYTIGVAQVAGSLVIEFEDQILPMRAYQQVRIEHVIPFDLMAARIDDAVAARQNADLVIIGTTNPARQPNGLEDAFRRSEAIRKTGAEVTLVQPGKTARRRSVGTLPPFPRAGGTGPVGRYYTPRNTGRRFSMKARLPSIKS
jgi:methylisocitrate lyase